MIDIRFPVNPTENEKAFKAWFDSLTAEEKRLHFMWAIGAYDGEDAPKWKGQKDE